MPNGLMSRGAAPGAMPGRGSMPGVPGRGGAQPGEQERVLMTLLTMLSQMPEAQVMLPVGALSTLVEGGGMGSLQPSMLGGGAGGRGMPQRGPASPGLATARQSGAPRPPQPGGVMGGGMSRTQMPPRQMLGGAQPRGNTQALMGLLGGR